MLVRRLSLGFLVLAVAAMPAWAVDAKLLPGDTEIVVSVNLKQMLESEVAKTYKEVINQAKMFIEQQVQNNPGAKHLEMAGFDLFRDLHGLTIASNGGKDLETGMIAFVHGTFNVEKIERTAEDIATKAPETLKVTKVNGRRAFEITPPGEKRFFAALLSDKTLVVCGTEAKLKETIDRFNGAAGKGLKAGFQALLKTTSDKQSLSFAGTGTALAKLLEQAPVPNADAAAGMLGQVDGISAAITLAKDVQFQLGVSAKDDETAQKTVAAGNFGLLTIRTLAAQKAKEDERLAPLVEVAKTLRITAEGANVLLRGEISTENLEKLIKNLPR